MNTQSKTRLDDRCGTAAVLCAAAFAVLSALTVAFGTSPAADAELAAVETQAAQAVASLDPVLAAARR